MSGSEYTRVLNMPGFEIYKSSEYARSPNILEFWICQDSEYPRVLNMPGF